VPVPPAEATTPEDNRRRHRDYLAASQAVASKSSDALAGKS
jgi:hypothetical protein